jgi:hypothetical protein
MDGIIVKTAVADYEIEEHLKEHNRFFKQTCFTLDDMDAYAQSFGPLVSAAYEAAQGSITREQAVQVLMSAINRIAETDAELDRKQAA